MRLDDRELIGGKPALHHLRQFRNLLVTLLCDRQDVELEVVSAVLAEGHAIAANDDAEVCFPPVPFARNTLKGCSERNGSTVQCRGRRDIKVAGAAELRIVNGIAHQEAVAGKDLVVGISDFRRELAPAGFLVSSVEL